MTDFDVTGADCMRVCRIGQGHLAIGSGTVVARPPGNLPVNLGQLLTLVSFNDSPKPVEFSAEKLSIWQKSESQGFEGSSRTEMACFLHKLWFLPFATWKFDFFSQPLRSSTEAQVGFLCDLVSLSSKVSTWGGNWAKKNGAEGHGGSAFNEKTMRRERMAVFK
jgi:hypothetical protein